MNHLQPAPCISEQGTLDAARAFPVVDYARKYRFLKVDVGADGVALVTLNRPEKLNATNITMHWEMGEIWRDVDNDPRILASVVTGAGDKAFCAGGDLEMCVDMATDAAVRRQVFQDARALITNIVNSRKPIVSAVNGTAVGAGMVMAVMADISIASSTAKFNDGHIRLGGALWPAGQPPARARP